MQLGKKRISKDNIWDIIKGTISNFLIISFVLFLVFPVPLSADDIVLSEVQDSTDDDGNIYLMINSDSYRTYLNHKISYSNGNCYIEFKGAIFPLYGMLYVESTPIFLGVCNQGNHLKNVYIVNGDEKTLIYQNKNVKVK